MNKQRRKALGDLMDRIEKRLADVEALERDVESFAEELDTLRNEEQDAFDNKSERAQESETGQEAQAGLESLDEAHTALDDLHSALESFDLVGEVLGKIDNARGP